MVEGIDKAGQAARAARIQDQVDAQRLEQEQADKVLAQAQQEQAAQQVSGIDAVADGSDAISEAGAADVGSSDVAGQERHEEAVTQASEQQDRGEDWSRFSATGEATEIPQGVEEIAAETKADDARQDGEQKDREQVNVGDLMKQMSIQSGIIKS